MDEEEIETLMDEEETKKTMYEKFLDTSPIFYRGCIIALVSMLSLGLPLLWFVVIYQLVMRKKREKEFFDALEEQVEEAFQEVVDSYHDAPMGTLD